MMKTEIVSESLNVDDVKFDPYGNYSIAEIPFEELEEIGGGLNIVCGVEVNNKCPKKGEDGDEE